MDLLAKAVTALLRKCVAEEAEDTFRGREDGIAKVLLILPLVVTYRSRHGGTALARKGMTFLRKVPCDVLLPSRPGGNWNDVRFGGAREVW